MNTNKTVLHHYLGTGLKVISEKSGIIRTLDGFHYLDDESINFITSENVYNSAIWNFKPALHSMNRLTIPLENGEIPIVKIAKICYPKLDFEALPEHGSVALNKTAKGIKVIYSDGLFKGSDNFQFYEYPMKNQLQLFQYLINNHFNCFGLSESEYIEKSTLKL